MAPVYRVIMVQYKSDVDADTKERIARGYLALAQQCTHERNGEPYFTVVGGTNNSQEGLSGATEVGPPFLSVKSVRNKPTHVARPGDFSRQQAFVATFRSKEDRDYFVHRDPVRARYRDQIMPSFEELRVADFEEDVF